MTDRVTEPLAPETEAGAPFPQPPYELRPPTEQGGWWSIWGTGWAIPLVALGPESSLRHVLGLLAAGEAAARAAEGTVDGTLRDGRPMPRVTVVWPPVTHRAQELAQAFREAVAAVHAFDESHGGSEDYDYDCPHPWCRGFWPMVREAEAMARALAAPPAREEPRCCDDPDGAFCRRTTGHYACGDGRAARNPDATADPSREPSRLTDAEVETIYAAYDEVIGSEAVTLDGKRSIVDPIYRAVMQVEQNRG